MWLPVRSLTQGSCCENCSSRSVTDWGEVVPWLSQTKRFRARISTGLPSPVLRQLFSQGAVQTRLQTDTSGLVWRAIR